MCIRDSDTDGDGVCEVADNCPVHPNPSQTDGDADGLGDTCDACTDADSDGVCDHRDACLATRLPESVPYRELGFLRWADVDGDRVFETRKRTAFRAFTLKDTAGCSCEQIIHAWNLGALALDYGCPTAAMILWSLTH